MKRVRRMTSISDRTLTRLLRAVVLVLVLGIPAFGAYYYYDQRVESGPSLSQRQATAAEQAVRKAPGDVAARLALAAAYAQNNQADAALQQYGEILKMDGKHRAALLGRGKILFIKGDLDGAASAYRKITSAGSSGEFAGADPQLEEAHFYLGSIAVKRGSWQVAQSELEAALKIEDTDSDAWYLLGSTQLQLGATKPAIDSLKRALMFVPSGWCDPYATLVTAYTKAGDPARAEYASAMVDFCQHKAATAKQRLEALAGGPVGVDSMLGLGMISESTSQRDDAVAWYRKVLTVDAANVSAITALSRLGVGPTASAVTTPRVSTTGKTG